MKNTDKKSTLKEEEEDEEPVSPTGRMMQTPKFNVSIILVMGYNTKIDPNLYKNCILLNLPKHPRFRSILVESNGKLCWRLTSTDIENHVFVPDVDPNMESPDEFVADFASNLSGIPMDMTKPLWESHILNVKTSDAESVVVMRIHHSLGDGVSLIALTIACSRKLDDPDSWPELPSLKKEKKNDDRGLVMRLFRFVWTVILITVYTLIDITSYIATLWLVRDAQTPLKVEHGAEPTQMRFVHRIVNLGDVKLVKNAMNVIKVDDVLWIFMTYLLPFVQFLKSINDVVLGVTEAGLSRYLNKIYENNKENGKEIVKKRSNYLPRNLRIRSSVVFNLRPSPTVEDMVEMMEKEELNGIWGNVIGIVILPFKIALQDDPLTHIRRAKSIMDRKKLSLGHKCASVVTKLTVSVFGVEAASRMVRATFNNTTFTFSNVMGPKEEVNLFGHHLSYIAPSIDGFRQSLVVHYQSYGEKLVISIGADEKVIPNPRQLCDDLIKSLQIMKEAVIKRGLVDVASQV